MKIRGKLSADTTILVNLDGGLRVSLRPWTRHIAQQTITRTTRKERDPATGRFVDTVDHVAFLKAKLRHILADWTGLTPDLLLDLVQLTDDVELDVPEPDADGCIPMSHEAIVWTDTAAKTAYTLPEFLWDKAAVEKFSRLIDATLEDYASALEAQAEKKSET